jgi:predicted deacylase
VAAFRKNVLISAIMLAAVLLFLPDGCEAAEYRQEVLMKGTRYKTVAYIQTVPEAPGPAVMILGGVHGSEPAGAAAAEKLLSTVIKKGTLIIVPRVNNLALRAGKRTLPDIGDVNRAAPGRANGNPDERIANEIMSMLKQYEVSLLIDMHEALDFTYDNKSSLGQSILPVVNPRSRALADAAILYVNKSLARPHEKFVVKRSGPIAGSIAQAAGLRGDIAAFILETSKKQPLDERVKQHMAIAKFMLARFELIDLPE